MYSYKQLTGVLEQLTDGLSQLFNEHLREVILFGSYARGDADEGSDVDVMVLVDLPREAIIEYRRQVANIAGNLLLANNVLISPIVENQAFFARYRGELPFYRNIDSEGVRISA